MENRKKKNILLTIDSLTGGGAELVVSNLCKYIDRNQFNVSICCLKNIGERGIELQRKGYDVEELPATQYRIRKYMSSLKLLELVKRKNIDLIHSHSTQSLLDGAFVKMMNKRIKHVHTFHFGNYPHLDRKYLFIEKIFSRIPDRLIAVGEEQKKTIRKVFGLNDKQILTIWNGIEVDNKIQEDAERLEKSGLSERRLIIGSISTLIEQKGINYLLEAIGLLNRRLNNFEVWIVGDGPLRYTLEEKSSTLGLNGVVKFLGWVHNASSQVLPRFDIFIQSSLWEAMSMVVLEAMAAGKAVIVTDVGDNKHLVEDEISGIIVKRKDPSDMAQKLEQLIKNEALRRELGMKAKEKIVRECSVSQMAQNYEALYYQVLG